MTHDPTLPTGRFATGVYRWVLKLYPAAFRQRYEGEMLRIFQEEWGRAAGEGPVASGRYTLHLAWDVFHTVPREWSMVIPRLALMTFGAAVLAIVYISSEPISLLLKVLIWAGLTGTFSVAVAMASGRTRATRFKVGALGLLLGLIFAPFVGLNPKLAAPPESPLVPVADPSLTGPEIYRRMAEVYRSARTYADEGEVQTVYHGVPVRTGIKIFGTAFVRNGGFRFGFRSQFDRLSSWDEYVIWKDNEAVKRWWTIQPQVVAEKDLAYALGGAAGVSGLASTLIPGLLEPATRGGVLGDRIAQITLLGTQRVDGVETFKLQLTTTYNPAFTLWVDARSYLIDRISHGDSLWGKTALRVDETIVYRPQLNVPVSAARLTFQPGPVPTGWRRFGSFLIGIGQVYATVFGVAITGAMVLLNLIHRRVLRKRWRGRKESWLAPLGKRMGAGYIGLFAICAGAWLGGVEFDDVMRNLILAQFMLQGVFLLYVIHRRSHGHIRFAVTA